MKREIQRCPGCARDEELFAQNNWCDCNPKAPFRMVPKVISEVASAQVIDLGAALNAAIKRTVSK